MTLRSPVPGSSSPVRRASIERCGCSARSLSRRRTLPPQRITARSSHGEGSRSVERGDSGSIWPSDPRCRDGVGVGRLQRLCAHSFGASLPRCRDGDATRKLGRAALERFPISSCSRWGLPGTRRYRHAGELLPHPFTLTIRPRKGDGGPVPTAIRRDAKARWPTRADVFESGLAQGSQASSFR